MKKLIAVFAMGAAFSMSAVAADINTEKTDAEMLFGSAEEPMAEMAALSSDEMKQTEGALLDISLGLNIGNTSNNWYWNWVNGGMPSRPDFN